MAYAGDRGGIEVLKAEQISCDVIEAADAWELWDVDTPDKLEQIRKVYCSEIQPNRTGL